MTFQLPETIEHSITQAVLNGRFTSIEEAISAAWMAFDSHDKAVALDQAIVVADIHRRMLADGLLTHLPDTAQDVDDEDDAPITIDGEPLSETIIRDRR